MTQRGTLRRLLYKTNEVNQHIGWLRMYIQGMKAENWRDMQLRADRQLNELQKAVSLGERLSEPKDDK